MFATQFVLDRFDWSSVTHLMGERRTEIIHTYIYYATAFLTQHTSLAFRWQIVFWCFDVRKPAIFIRFRCVRFVSVCGFVCWLMVTCISYLHHGIVSTLFHCSKAYLPFEPMAKIWMCFMAHIEIKVTSKTIKLLFDGDAYALIDFC